MNEEQFITSGFLELYALDALPPEEMRQVEEMAAQYPHIKDELYAITEGLIKYAEVYAPETSKDLYNRILTKVQNVGKAEEPVPVIAPPVIPIQKEKEKEKEKQKEENKAPRLEKEKQKETAALPQKEKQKEITPQKEKELTPQKEKQKTTDVVKIRPLYGRYPLAIAACIVLLIISVSVNLYLNSQINDAQGQLMAMQEANEAMAANNTALKTQFDKTDAELKLFTDPLNKMVMMKGMPVSPGSEVMVVWNTQSNDVFVDVHHLPAPPDGMQYQLWAIDSSGRPTNAGLLTPYKERKQKGPEQMKTKIMEATAFAITLEPKGGSESPTVKNMYVKGGV